MANPRDNSDPLLRGEYAFGRELYLNEKTGRTHVRMPVGGSGGGVTSYADAPASEEVHVAFLRSEADRKQAESDVLKQQHDDAHAELQDKKAGEADVNNPITDDTYGRPPQHVEAGNQPGPLNPADGRDPADDQPKSEPVKVSA